MDHQEQKCNGCGYDLRGKSLESEFCPECGAYLSLHESEVNSITPPLVLFRTLSNDDGRILVRNATLPAGVVESHLKKASHNTEKWAILGIGAVILSFFSVCYLVFVLPSALRDFALESVFLTFIGLIALHIAVYKFYVKGVLIRRTVIHHVRKSMSRAGHDICLTCGWINAPEQADLKACPHCQASRLKRHQQ